MKDTVSLDIEITSAQDHLPIAASVLADLARKVLSGQGVGSASISIALVDDAAIHAINRRHLDHDWPTDVITFRLSDPQDDLLEAELVISAEMAVTTARAAGTDPEAELMLYMVHGLLHLCGYDDTTAANVQAMRRREDEVLRQAGFVNTFSMVVSDSGPEGRGSAPCRA